MDDRRSRLRWRCRRGMRELDEIFARYIAAGFDDLDEAGLDTLERLLDQPDMDVLAWMMGHREPEDPALAGLCVRIRGARPDVR